MTHLIGCTRLRTTARVTLYQNPTHFGPHRRSATQAALAPLVTVPRQRSLEHASPLSCPSKNRGGGGSGEEGTSSYYSSEVSSTSTLHHWPHLTPCHWCRNSRNRPTTDAHIQRSFCSRRAQWMSFSFCCVCRCFALFCLSCAYNDGATWLHWQGNLHQCQSVRHGNTCHSSV